MKSQKSEFPDTQSLYALLEDFRGKSAFVVPMVDGEGRPLGNNGDALMHWVFDQILDELQIVRSGIDDADVMVVPPNGALLEVYRFPWLLRDEIAPGRQLPLVIFPSSALFETVDPSFMFEGREARTIWIFREANSLDKIASCWGGALNEAGVELVLDHDVVASGHRFVPQLFATAPVATKKRLLVGARTDVEAKPLAPKAAPGSHLGGLAFSRRLFFRLPRRLRLFIARKLFRTRLENAANTLLVKAATGGSVVSPSDFARRSYADISAVEYADFRAYINEISLATTVVTDRLHIALPAAILGKEVVLVEAGYHKLRGVYNQSLRGAANVALIVPPRGQNNS